MRWAGRTDVSNLQVTVNELTPVSEPLYAFACLAASSCLATASGSAEAISVATSGLQAAKMSSSTGSPISSRYRGSTGIGITMSSRRITRPRPGLA